MSQVGIDGLLPAEPGIGRFAARILLAWAALASAIFVAAELAGDDRRVAQYLCGARAGHPVLASAARLLTDTANPPVTTAITVASCAVAVLARQLRAALVLALTPILATETAALIRSAAARRRPDLSCSVAHLHSFSLPSGHALGATVGSGLLGLWLLHMTQGKWHTRLLLPAAWAWAISVSWSRVTLGLHYPADVASGMLLGVAFLLAANELFRRLYRDRPAGAGCPAVTASGGSPAQRTAGAG